MTPNEALLPHLRAARDLIDRDYAQQIDLDALAARAACSRYHFLRSFRAAYGETPFRYLTRRRIERAKDLLRSANLTVTEVCWLVGFASLGSFSSRFHELVGVPPSVYREQALQSKPPPIPGCHLLMWTLPQSGISRVPPPSPSVEDTPSQQGEP